MASRSTAARAPSATGSITEELRAAEQALQTSGVVLTTSGSTGHPKQVVLSAAALRASAQSTAERLGGHGQWLLTLPTDHVAGWQVMVRSVLAGTVPVRLAGSFSPAAFRAAAAELGPGPRMVSLVPTQLHRILQEPSARSALAEFDAVLIGGAALPGPLRQHARDAGVRVHRTYGMTETSGGCVYDGTPLDGVQIALEEGRVLLGGPVLANEYRGSPELTRQRFRTDPDGRRWFRTDDLGEIDPDGRLRLLGRVDDVINTGGLKVAPRPVEEALLALSGVGEALVVGVPDPEWGQRVAAVLVAAPAGQAAGPSGSADQPPAPGPRVADGTPTAAIREMLRDRLPSHALPRQVLWVTALPMLASGKPDRAALRHLCATASGTMGSPRGSAT